MEIDKQKKVRHICARVAFLMEHQEILPDLKEIISEMDSESEEYIKGAHDALQYLIDFLAQKGR